MEPSSTQMTSKSVNVWRRNVSSATAMYFSALYTGTTNETTGCSRALDTAGKADGNHSFGTSTCDSPSGRIRFISSYTRRWTARRSCPLIRSA